MFATGSAVGCFAKTYDDPALDASARSDCHVASIAMISDNSSYAFPRAPPIAPGRDVAAEIAASARGSARKTSRPPRDVVVDGEAISHAASRRSAVAAAATENGRTCLAPTS